jgi:hypothetical protein
MTSTPQLSINVTSKDGSAGGSGSGVGRSIVTPINLQESVSYNFVTRSKWFQRLVKWSFDCCDTNKTGQVDPTQLYAGILLIHVQLAKYCGAAACYPPSITTIHALFYAADDNSSGTIDEDEFVQIVVICFAQITSRIVVYYTFMILLVPHIAMGVIRVVTSVDELLGLGMSRMSSSASSSSSAYVFRLIEHVMTIGSLVETIITLLISLLLVPICFDWIDTLSHQTAVQTKTHCVTKED